MTLLPLALLLVSPIDPASLKQHPRYPLYQRASQTAGNRTKLNDLQVRWSPNGESAFIQLDGKWTKITPDGKQVETEATQVPREPIGPQRRRAPRGQSLSSEPSPDGTAVVSSKGGTIFLKQSDQEPMPILTSSDPKIQHGAVSWVYGEEWGQTQAMGWTADSQFIWALSFDNRPVQPFAMVTDPTGVRSNPWILDYPKAGAPNPQVKLIYRMREGGIWSELFSTSDPEDAYVWDIRPYGDSALIYQTSDRKQSVRRVHFADLKSGERKILWTEQLAQGYVPSGWAPREKFGSLWVTTEQNGYANFVRLEPTKKPMVMSQVPFESQELLAQNKDWLYFSASGSEIGDATQIFRVPAKGGKATQLTDTKLANRWVVAPDGKSAITFSQGADNPLSGGWWSLGKKPKMEFALTLPSDKPNPRCLNHFFKAADGTTLGINLELPSDYDKSRAYPLIVDVYNGPETSSFEWIQRRPRAMTEFGVIVAQIESRGGLGRGAAFRNSLYQKLGIVEIDDIAAGVQSLVDAGIVEAGRVGIYGTSYGGYTSLMALLRYPRLFSAAVASSSVVDWAHYDSIYTERYMNLPQDVPEAYKAGSALTYLDQYAGGLLLFFGMRDDNVHPNQSMALLQAMRRKRLYPDVVIGPTEGHSYVGNDEVLSYMIQRLKI